MQADSVQSYHIANHLIVKDCRAGFNPLGRLKPALQHQLHRKCRKAKVKKLPFLREMGEESFVAVIVVGHAGRVSGGILCGNGLTDG